MSRLRQERIEYLLREALAEISLDPATMAEAHSKARLPAFDCTILAAASRVPRPFLKLLLRLRPRTAASEVEPSRITRACPARAGAKPAQLRSHRMHDMDAPSLCSADELLAASRRFVQWLDREGMESFDPYDIWGTKYGLWSRKNYYRNRRLGTPLVAPLVLVDLLWPSARKLFVRRQRFATADAQVLLAFLNLYEVSQEPQFLSRAIQLGDEILGYAIPGYRGPCWGYPFDWQRDDGAVWARNTPYITCTPYCYEAFAALHGATGDPRYSAIMQGIAGFVCGDLRDTPVSATASAGSYSPCDNGQVVNASAYRAWLLVDAGRRFDSGDFTRTGTGNLNFVLESQREDGSWLYAMGEGSSFIDNFHTCFNLKNLFKLNRLLNREDIRSSIRRGYEYYRAALLYENGDPKSFALEPRIQLSKLEMYNFAEGITLGALLSRDIAEGRLVAHRMGRRLLDDFQLADGHFATRVFRGGIRHTFPFLRGPQAQLFLATTNLLRESRL